MGGETIGDEDLRSRGLSCGWDQNSLVIGPPLDAIWMDDLGQHPATWNKVQTPLAGEHARLSVHVLGILNRAMGENRPKRDSTTPNSLLRTYKFWYLVPALLRTPDGRIKKRQMFAMDESGDIVLLLPWLMGFTRGRDSGPRDAALEASKEAKLKRVSSACH